MDYDGSTHSLQSIMQNKGVYSPAFIFDSATQLSGVNADTYNAKVTLSSPHKWIVDDGGGAWHTEDGTVAKQIEWKIKPRRRRSARRIISHYISFYPMRSRHVQLDIACAAVIGELYV